MPKGSFLTARCFTAAAGSTVLMPAFQTPAEWTPVTPNTARHLTVCNAKITGATGTLIQHPIIWAAQVVVRPTLAQRFAVWTVAVRLWAEI